VQPVTEGNCYLVLRSLNSGQDYPIGWYDLRQIAANNQNPVLQLSQVMVMETVMEYGVQRPIGVYQLVSKWKGVRE
jgi:hypothetical protein